MVRPMRVLCVTPNVSVDRVMTVPGFAAGGVWRAQSVHAVCGGKGVNVARAVRRLGHDALCAGPIAGHAGRYAAEQAAAEGLNACWTVGPGETRTCTIVVHDGASTVINEPGSALPRQDWRRFVGDVVRAAHKRAPSPDLTRTWTSSSTGRRPSRRGGRRGA